MTNKENLNHLLDNLKSMSKITEQFAKSAEQFAKGTFENFGEEEAKSFSKMMKDQKVESIVKDMTDQINSINKAK